MQYTSKIALLAVALFGTSALAAPFAGEAAYEVEAREVENDLSAREFFEVYLSARADPSLDVRDLESLDLDARDYLEYLEARAAATAVTESPQTPQTPLPQKLESSHVETKEHSHGDHEAVRSESKSDSATFLTPHQKSVHETKERAVKAFEDPQLYQTALTDKENEYHRFAVQKYLSKPKHLKKALANNDSPYHKAAKRIVHRRKAKAYLADEKHLTKALKHKHHKYHKDAVKLYFSHGDNFEHALSTKKDPLHKAAVHEYLLDNDTRMAAIADKTSPYYKQATKLQKKLDKKHDNVKVSAGSNSTVPPQKA